MEREGQGEWAAGAAEEALAGWDRPADAMGSTAPADLGAGTGGRERAEALP